MVVLSLMLKERLGRPRKAVTDNLRGMVASDYEKLLQAVVGACIEHAGKNNYPSIVVAFHYLTQFADGFPRGYVIKKEGQANYHRIKARKLLDWLRENGHTTLTVDDIAAASLRHTRMEKDILNGLL